MLACTKEEVDIHPVKSVEIDEFLPTSSWASTDVRLVRSRRVLEKLGMQPEAVRVGDHRGRAGELVDEMVYGLNLAPIDNSSP